MRAIGNGDCLRRQTITQSWRLESSFSILTRYSKMVDSRCTARHADIREAIDIDFIDYREAGIRLLANRCTSHTNTTFIRSTFNLRLPLALPLTSQQAPSIQSNRRTTITKVSPILSRPKHHHHNQCTYLTYAPALPLKNKHVPATSSGVPILPSGIPPLIFSPLSSNVFFIILL